MSRDELLRLAESVIERCWEEGCPIAHPGARTTLARTAILRWQSFDQREGHAAASSETRVEDLAKGLRDAFETDRRLVGPLMSDYRWLAEKLAILLRDQTARDE